MGCVYYMIDDLHETRFDLDKHCGWLPETGNGIRILGRDGLVAMCVAGLSRDSVELEEHWRAFGEWLWAFCVNAEFRVRLIDDCSGDGEPWWDWPVVLERCG